MILLSEPHFSLSPCSHPITWMGSNTFHLERNSHFSQWKKQNSSVRSTELWDVAACFPLWKKRNQPASWCHIHLLSAASSARSSAPAGWVLLCTSSPLLPACRQARAERGCNERVCSCKAVTGCCSIKQETWTCSLSHTGKEKTEGVEGGLSVMVTFLWVGHLSSFGPDESPSKGT